MCAYIVGEEQLWHVNQIPVRLCFMGREGNAFLQKVKTSFFYVTDIIFIFLF